MKRNLLSICLLIAALSNGQIYSNGNFSTGNTASPANTPAPVGYTWSELQGNNTILGVSGHLTSTASYRLSDDFTVPATESWAVSSIEVFCYQTNAVSQPIDGLTVRIFNGAPDIGTVIFGDGITNAFNAAGSGEAFVYRTGKSAADTARKVWKKREISLLP